MVRDSGGSCVMATSMVTRGVPWMMSAAWVAMAYGGGGGEVVWVVFVKCVAPNKSWQGVAVMR